MRFFFGLIIGCFMTIGIVYVHDSMVPPNLAIGMTTSRPGAIVNWDEANTKWVEIKEDAHIVWVKLKEKIS